MVGGKDESSAAAQPMSAHANQGKYFCMGKVPSVKTPRGEQSANENRNALTLNRNAI